MKNLLLLLLTLFWIPGCVDDDDTPGFPELAVELVTGINLSDANGQALGKMGNPNVKPGGISVYPNPLTGNSLAVQAPEPVGTVWLMKATAQKTNPPANLGQLLEEHSYSVEEIKAFPVKEYTPTAQAFILDLDGLEAGYYRIFFQSAPSEDILWDNFYFSPGKTFEEVWAELDAFWN